MNEMTLPSRQKIRNSSPGGLRAEPLINYMEKNRCHKAEGEISIIHDEIIKYG